MAGTYLYKLTLVYNCRIWSNNFETLSGNLGS